MGYQIADTVCPGCKKNFIPAPFHAYEDGGVEYCSWTCFLHRKDGHVKKNLKPVYQYTPDGVFLRSFKSAAEAADHVGVQRAANIRECCVGKVRTSGGYVWSYTKKTPYPAPTKALDKELKNEKE